MKPLFIAALAVAVLSAPTRAAQTDETAEQRFERCAGCHQPPDLRFATDRAWLDQVRRTA